MTEQFTQIIHKENIEDTSQKNIWGASYASGLTIASVENMKEIHGNVHVLATLCPLYAPGTLEQSALLKIGGVAESRVANKWSALAQMLSTLSTYQKHHGHELSATLVFANKGVLLGRPPTVEDEQALAQHNEIYYSLVEQFCEEHAIELQYHNYDSLNIQLQRFINPNEEITNSNTQIPNLYSESHMIQLLNQYVGSDGTDYITDNKKNRKRISRILNMWKDENGQLKKGGFENAFWLITGYLPFDYHIPHILDSVPNADGIYLVTERFEPLFSIANFSECLQTIPRINIKA